MKPAQDVELLYDLEDAERKTLFEGKAILSPRQAVLYASLPIPAAKLAMGTTMLKVMAEQSGAKATSSLTIYANVGYSPEHEQTVASLIEPMRYIMEEKEWQVLKNAAPEERMRLFKAFWEARRPLRSRTENPLLAEFYLRLEEANARFRWSTIEGWKTDRGRVFIICGPPDNIEHERRYSDNAVLEIWTYTETGQQFVFQDPFDTGDFRLISGTVQ